MEFELLPAQKEFMLIPPENKTGRDVALYQGGFGCVSGDTLLDTPFGKIPIKDFKGGFIWSYFKDFKVLVFATKPQIYDKKPLFEVKTKNGLKIECTKEHKFLTRKGFKPLNALNIGDEVCTYSHNPAVSISGFCPSKSFSGVPHLLQKFQDFLLHCFGDCRLYGGRPQKAVNTFSNAVPLQDDVLAHSHDNLQKDVQDISKEHNHPCQCAFRHSKSHFVSLSDLHALGKVCYVYGSIFVRLSLFCLLQALFLLSSFLLQPFVLLFQLFSNRFDTSCFRPSFTTIENITQIKADLYYDLHVPLINCYNAQGFINHNSGKTWSGSLIGICLCMQYPGITGLVGAMTFPLVRDTTLKQYFEHLDNMGFVAGVHYEYKVSESKLCFKNGSTVLFKHLEEPNKLKSLNLGFVELEEMSDTPESTFKMLLSRLRQQIQPEWREKGFKYRLLGHTNPEPAKGWIYKYFVEQKPDNYRLIQAPTTQNKYLEPDYVDSLKEIYDPEYYRINVLGEFGDYTSGLIVKNFTKDNIKELTYLSNEDLYLTWDFNVDPMSCILAHKTPDKVFFFDEFILENTTTKDTIRAVIDRYPNHKGRIIICGDASGDNRNTQSEYTNYVIIRNELRRHYPKNEIHLALRPFNPPIKNRIAAFNAMVKDYNGKRKLFIDKKCEKLLYNIYNLKYKPGTSIVDVPSYTQIKNDNSLKFLEHPFDAASYLVEKFHPIRSE